MPFLAKKARNLIADKIYPVEIVLNTGKNTIAFQYFPKYYCLDLTNNNIIIPI